MAKTESSLPSVTDLLRTTVQSIIAFTAVIYTIGFIVVNSYFTKFGITDYGLVQTRYVAAGLNYVAVHLSIAAMIAVIVAVMEKETRFLWLSLTLLVWGLFGVSAYLIGGQLDSALVAGVNAIVISLIAHQVWAAWARNKSTWYDQLLSSRDISQQSFLMVFSAGAILLLSASALTWGRSLWPLMSPTLGGGRPSSAVLIIKPDALPSSGLSLVPMQSESASMQLPVLFESSNEYVVLISLPSEDSAAVKLPKSIVISAIYAPTGLAGQTKSLPALSSTSTPAPMPSSTTTSTPGSMTMTPQIMGTASP